MGVIYDFFRNIFYATLTAEQLEDRIATHQDAIEDIQIEERKVILTHQQELRAAYREEGLMSPEEIEEQVAIDTEELMATVKKEEED